MTYPGQLDDAVARWLATRGGSQRAATQRLQASYKAGAASDAGDLSAYVTARLPATFAANQAVMAEVAARMPAFTPSRLLDCGAGPGTASWAAVAQWASLADVTQIDVLPAFVDLASQLNASSKVPALMGARVFQNTLETLPAVTADLVVASYVLAELPEQKIAGVALSLWKSASAVLVLIEPGTPQGFARLKAARVALAGKATIIAPCTHDAACPMTDGDWCHFKTRLARSREHMHAKAATVPFEDEAFSYLVVGRAPTARAKARIIAPVSVSKSSAMLRLCHAAGLSTSTIASRDKPAYKRAKKARWGEVWSDT